MFDLNKIQGALKEFGFDGWLFFDFHGANVLARRILDFEPTSLVTRRFYYMVPAEGEPTKLVHRIESGTLDHLPGDKRIYLKWEELEAGIAELVKGMKQVAMEYSPRNAIPYVSKVDGGTIDLVKGAGVEVASSGDLIQFFEATLSDEQWQSHVDTEKLTTQAFDLCWQTIAEGVGAGTPRTETEVQKVILDHFEKHDLIPDHPPIVAVGPHSGDPHFEPTPDRDVPVAEGELVMIDLWARLNKPKAVFSDITRMGYVGSSVPEKYAKIFDIVAAARDAAIDLIRDRFAAGKELRGWEVDDAAREVIEKAGYGQYFVHRTGHSIGEDLHGNGTHMDNLETHDDRLVLPNTLFSIEPGIYTDEFGVRLEVNVFVDGSGGVHVTGGVQNEIRRILG
ncbi:MAG: aminopeptidase P family protein [Candidatus Krumholzibacteria bacterium]|nr:aminopeptidase P family protein [Candidatus Krumholzibacteria bacterium]